MDKIKTKLDVPYNDPTFNDPIDVLDAKNAEAGTLIPYLTSDKTPNVYNDVRLVGGSQSAKSYGIKGLPRELVLPSTHTTILY
jgi:hypothetical protein